MRLFLPSFGMGNHSATLREMLKGGKRAAVILNAKDHAPRQDRRAAFQVESGNLEKLQLEPVELDLRDFFGGRSSGIREVLEQFDLLWIRGGNAFNLRRAMKQSGADDAIRHLLMEDRLVYGGFSAAAAVLGPSLCGLELVDDPKLLPEQYNEEVVWDGLRLLPYQVAPHYDSDHPESSAVSILVSYYIQNHVLFKALNDHQTLVVDGAETRVLTGEDTVARH